MKTLEEYTKERDELRAKAMHLQSEIKRIQIEAQAEVDKLMAELQLVNEVFLQVKGKVDLLEEMEQEKEAS